MDVASWNAKEKGAYKGAEEGGERRVSNEKEIRDARFPRRRKQDPTPAFLVGRAITRALYASFANLHRSLSIGDVGGVDGSIDRSIDVPRWNWNGTRRPIVISTSVLSAIERFISRRGNLR